MQDALKEDPHDAKRIAILAEFYRVTAYAALREKNEKEANRRFTIALSYLEQELQILSQPSQKIASPNTVPDTMLKKAEVQMMLKSFQAAIATLGQIMDLQQGNADRAFESRDCRNSTRSISGGQRRLQNVAQVTAQSDLCG